MRDNLVATGGLKEFVLDNLPVFGENGGFMSAEHWYYTANGQTFGPFSSETLRQMAKAGVITPETLVGKGTEGAARKFSEIEWEPLCAVRDPSLLSTIAGGVSEVSGLERLEGFTLRGFFARVFTRHTPEETEEHFAIGTRTTTPALSQVNAAWPTPSAFVKFLLLSVLATIGFYYAMGRFGGLKLIPGWIFMGCFGVPFSVLVFFLEVNVLRNVSAYRVLYLMLMGGLLSLLASLFLFDYTGLDNWLGPMSAGLIEESGKLLTVIYFMKKWRGYGWILNGLLFGAAVGTGFSAFESAGYVLEVMLGGAEFGGEITMILRALLSPFTHTIWTAAAAAALWRVKGDRPFKWGMLGDPRFLRIFGLVALLHFTWNSPLKVPGVGEFFSFCVLKIILGVVGWMIVLPLIQAGLKEVRAAQAATPQPLPPAA